jgi:hypothetical protein
MVAQAEQFLRAGKAIFSRCYLKAGFAHGDQDYLPLAIESIGRLSSRIAW